MAVIQKLRPEYHVSASNLPDGWEDGIGNKVLGEGVTGKVFASDDGSSAIKLCRRTKPYDLFMEFVREQDSPHVPAILDIRYAKPGRMRVEMELLEPLDPATADWQKINSFANVCHAVVEGRPVADVAPFRDTLNDFAWSLGRFARLNRLALDLQCANIMVRPGTDEIVFVDPLR